MFTFRVVSKNFYCNRGISRALKFKTQPVLLVVTIEPTPEILMLCGIIPRFTDTLTPRLSLKAHPAATEYEIMKLDLGEYTPITSTRPLRKEFVIPKVDKDYFYLDFSKDLNSKIFF